MSIFIQKDCETAESVDYFFLCDVHESDPRYKSRYFCSGQRRGIFRITKHDLAVELLFPMELDAQAKCFNTAATKVVSILKAEGRFPEKAQYAAG
jgi:hypothetical protein